MKKSINHKVYIACIIFLKYAGHIGLSYFPDLSFSQPAVSSVAKFTISVR